MLRERSRSVGRPEEENIGFGGRRGSGILVDWRIS